MGDVSWIDLIPLNDITGPAGNDGADGADGTDGREVEFQKSATHIQWRYVGDVSWTNLVALTDITGPQGATGASGTSGFSTVGLALGNLTNPSAIRFLRINADNTVTALNAADFRTAIGAPSKDTIAFSSKPVQTVNASTTTFNFIDGSWTFSTQGVRQEPVPYGGVFESLFVRLAANQTASGALVVTLQVNGTDTALTVTVAAGTQTNNIQGQSVAVNAGDLVGYKIQNLATGASAIINVINAGFQRTA